MANPDRPHGFRPIGRLSGGDLRSHNYTLAAANTTIGINDLVILTDAGTIDIAAAGATQILGVAGAAADASSGDSIPVYDDTDILVEAQMDDGTGTGTGLANMYGNFNIVATAHSVGDISIMEADESSQADTATLPLKAISLYDIPGNEYGEFQRTVFIINNHVLKSLGVTGLT